MLTLTVFGKPKPKPAGCLKYRHGRAYISMDSNGYLTYKRSVVAQIKQQTGLINQLPYGVVYHIKAPNLCRLGDLSNICEALQDCLVDAGIIKDDRPGILKRIHCVLEINSINFSADVHLCYDSKEFYTMVVQCESITDIRQ